VALDLRGHGESDKPDEDYGIPTFVDDVAWLIGELNLDKPVVVGHSMGGTIALNLARRHPDLLKAVILVDSPIHPFPEATRGLVDQTLAALKTPAYQGVAAGFVRMVMFNDKSPPLLVEEVVAGMSSAPKRVMHTAIASTLSEESMLAGALPVPALYIRAATQIASEDQLRERYPGIGVVTIPAAHFVQMEQPAATNNVISDFLDKLE
jgi:pimeloyl-ACP methyl ester carboxylesterase